MGGVMESDDPRCSFDLQILLLDEIPRVVWDRPSIIAVRVAVRPKA
jgi:hypothetical protein